MSECVVAPHITICEPVVAEPHSFYVPPAPMSAPVVIHPMMTQASPITAAPAPMPLDVAIFMVFILGVFLFYCYLLGGGHE